VTEKLRRLSRVRVRVRKANGLHGVTILLVQQNAVVLNSSMNWNEVSIHTDPHSYPNSKTRKMRLWHRNPAIAAMS